MVEPSMKRMVLADWCQPPQQPETTRPEAYELFAEDHPDAFNAGHLPVKTKELIALAVAVAHGSASGIERHGEGAARAGAGRDEVAEAIGVVVALCGGSALVAAPVAYSTFCAYSAAAN